MSDKAGVIYERRKRKAFLESNEELSKYYPLPEGKKDWTFPTLLAEGKCGGDHHSIT